MKENIRKDQKLQRLRTEKKALSKDKELTKPKRRAEGEKSKPVRSDIQDFVDKQKDQPLRPEDIFRVRVNNDYFPESVRNAPVQEKLRWQIGSLIETLAIGDYEHFVLGSKIVDFSHGQHSEPEELLTLSVSLCLKFKRPEFQQLYTDISLTLENTKEFTITDLTSSPYSSIPQTKQMTLHFKISPNRSKYPYNFPFIRLTTHLKDPSPSSKNTKAILPLTINKFVRMERISPSDFSKNWDLNKSRILISSAPNALNEGIIKSRNEILFFFKKMCLLNPCVNFLFVCFGNSAFAVFVCM